MTLLKTLIFTVLVPGTVTVYIPWWLLTSQGSGIHFAGGLWWLGTLPFLLGLSFYLWCAWDFTFAGHGTPAPIDSPKYLVVRGLYRVVRNPMYVGVALALIGEALVFGSLLLAGYAALFLLVVHLFIVIYEEPGLQRKFGASYEQYCAQVPRWIPRPSVLWQKPSTRI